MHEVTFLILAALQRGPADGNAILERMSARDAEDARPSLPTLYRWLRAGIERGWIEVTGTRDDEGRGRPRQVYALTERGVGALEAEARRHRDLGALVLESRSAGGVGEA